MVRIEAEKVGHCDGEMEMADLTVGLHHAHLLAAAVQENIISGESRGGHMASCCSGGSDSCYYRLANHGL
ncbi:hypothetical protein SUGI_0646620 [Cryptomeria japonica]|nr:hypothetical protein SUGI_0646620 [Cryptomeria japonica]